MFIFIQKKTYILEIKLVGNNQITHPYRFFLYKFSTAVQGKLASFRNRLSSFFFIYSWGGLWKEGKKAKKKKKDFSLIFPVHIYRVCIVGSLGEKSWMPNLNLESLALTYIAETHWQHPQLSHHQTWLDVEEQS